MNRKLRSIQEFLAPGTVSHSSLPPMEAGLRPNADLESAREVTEKGSYEPEDVIWASPGVAWFTSGMSVFETTEAGIRKVADLGGPGGSIELFGGLIVIAVEGRGLVSVDPDGGVRELCNAESVLKCVTDMAALTDGTLLVTIGSQQFSADEWSRALLAKDSTGLIVKVTDGTAQVVATDLAWPGGICQLDDQEILLSVGFSHLIERRWLSTLDKRERVVRKNLPVYPGRIRRCDEGWWIAAPYARNRFTELIMDEPKLLSEMVEGIDPPLWPVPRLRDTTPYTDVLQMGQLRMLGVLKAWAPPRSYGLLFLLDGAGRVVRSHHSRVDGHRHGITGMASFGGRLMATGKGCQTLLEIGGA